MYSIMSMMMLLMCTVSYAGDVHNVLGINDFITFSGVLLCFLVVLHSF